MSAIDRQRFVDTPLRVDDRGLWFGPQLAIMETWEKPYIESYMRRILEEYRPESVLEIGFGLGYTAQVIYDFGIPFYAIVEAHPQILANALRWSADKPGVKIIAGFVEDVVLPAAVDLIWDDRPEVTSYGDDWISKVRATHYIKYDVLTITGWTQDEYKAAMRRLKATGAV